VKIVRIEEAIMNIKSYLDSIPPQHVPYPFFVVVENASDYGEILETYGSLEKVRISDYCVSDDSLPNYDEVCSVISVVEKPALLLGLGESINVGGDVSIFGRLANLQLQSKLLVLCRGTRDYVREFCSYDNKFNSPRRLCVLHGGDSFQIVSLSHNLKFAAENGVKPLLARLESGATGVVYVKTSQPLHGTKEVTTAHEAVMEINPTSQTRAEWLSEVEWEGYLDDGGLRGYDLFHWRTFLLHKMHYASDEYLKHVVNKAENYNAYKKLIFSALLDFSPNHEKYEKMYDLRKALLKNAGINDTQISEYVTETKIKDGERLYYLTDNTDIERKAIIESLSGLSIIPQAISRIYPALNTYLHDYVFEGEKGELFTSYFSTYKRLKLMNKISEDFNSLVLSLAIDGRRAYNRLETRGTVLDSLRCDGTALFWMDALGAEFIGYIQKCAQLLGLKIKIHVVQAELPTITSYNNDFWDSWVGDKQQTKKLDTVKHNGEKDFSYEVTKLPIHIVAELRIIDEVLGAIATALTGKTASSGNAIKKYLLVSDHGASRLAVINEQESKWEMASKGKHSGRCCPCNEADVKSEYAAKSGDDAFWVLANYDRFKGGRKGAVEVHGGATLEEVVIPLIEFELFDNTIQFTLTSITTTSYKKDAELILFSTSPLKNVAILVQENGKKYFAEDIGNNKHRIVLPDIKKAGRYNADVFEGHNLIGKSEFEIQRESGKTTDSDWFG